MDVIKIRAIIYKRVSSHIQVTDGVSLELQDERLKAYIMAQGWELVDIYEDAGLSGSDTNRPAFQQMLKAAAQRKFDCIVVYKLDRLSRSVRDFHDLITKLDEYNISIVSMTQNLDTSTAVGRLLRNILVDFANFEREMITERTMDAKYSIAQKGQWLGGIAPYGYKTVDKKLVVVPEEAEIVKGVYEDYTKGLSVRDLMKKYNFPSTSRVTRILWNPVYAGLLGYSKTRRKANGPNKERKPIEEWILVPGEHEAIITEEMYYRVKELKNMNNRSPGTRTKDQIFENLVYCKCGKRMFYYYSSAPKKYKNTYRYYRCNTGSKMENGCRFSVNENFIEEKISKLLKELTLKKTWEVIKNDLKDNNKSSKKNNIKNLENELSKNKSKISNLINRMAEEEIQSIAKYLVEEIKKLETRNKEILLQIETQKIEDTKIVSFDETIKLITDIAKFWDKSTRQGKRTYARILFKKITVTENSIIVQFTDHNIPDQIC